MPVLEISELGCHLATFRGFVTLSVKGDEINRIPFEHISAIITKAHGITYTQNLLVKLAKRNIPVVITDKSFMPVSMILPIGAHHATAKYLSAQVAAKMAQKNLLWQKLIQSKIKFQIAILDYCVPNRFYLHLVTFLFAPVKTPPICTAQIGRVLLTGILPPFKRPLNPL